MLATEENIPRMITLDVMGRRTPIKEFFFSTDMTISFFHDSIDLLPKMAAFGVLSERTILYFSSSWYVSERRAKRFRQLIHKAQDVIGAGVDIAANMVFMANSPTELSALRKALPATTDVILVNNTCFLNTSIYTILPHARRKWLCAINSKPFPFKRLELSALVPDKIFITYMEEAADRYNTPRISLPELNPSAIFRNIADHEVATRLNQCQVAAILSEEEGACYANTEYLLCGLPVVSTPSRGGRDVFYDEVTAIICEPDATEVALAVRRAADRLERGEITRKAVRQRTLDRIGAFRETLIDSLRRTGGRFGLEIDFDAHLAACLSAGNKMEGHRNLFLKDVELS